MRDWPASEAFVLISEYRVRKCLWEKTHPGYKNNAKKAEQYKEIARLFTNCNANDVKEKIRNLRTIFWERLRKMPKGEVAAGQQPKWKFFAALAFLKNSATARDSIDWMMLDALRPAVEGRKNSKTKMKQLRKRCYKRLSSAEAAIVYLESQIKDKKARDQNKRLFRQEWREEYPWLEEEDSPQGKKCSICNSSLTGGRAHIERHASSESHMRAEKLATSTQKLEEDAASTTSMDSARYAAQNVEDDGQPFEAYMESLLSATQTLNNELKSESSISLHSERREGATEDESKIRSEKPVIVEDCVENSMEMNKQNYEKFGAFVASTMESMQNQDLEKLCEVKIRMILAEISQEAAKRQLQALETRG